MSSSPPPSSCTAFVQSPLKPKKIEMTTSYLEIHSPSVVVFHLFHFSCPLCFLVRFVRLMLITGRMTKHVHIHQDNVQQRHTDKRFHRPTNDSSKEEGQRISRTKKIQHRPSGLRPYLSHLFNMKISPKAVPLKVNLIIIIFFGY